jgi:hypothetical protein
MKLAILSSVLGVTCAFAPVSQNAQRFTALRLSETEKAEAESSATSETPFFASSSAVRGTSSEKQADKLHWLYGHLNQVYVYYACAMSYTFFQSLLFNF